MPVTLAMSVRLPRRGLAPDPTVELAAAWARVTEPQFRAALRGLDPLCLRAYELRVVERLRYAQIARRLDVTHDDVAALLSRARRELRRRLGPRAPTRTLD